MKIQAVKSDAIDVVAYDENTHKLRVTLKQQKPQDFCHVPEHIFNAFVQAKSKNRFFKRHILDSFPC